MKIEITTWFLILALAATAALSKHPLIHVGDLTVQDSFRIEVRKDYQPLL